MASGPGHSKANPGNITIGGGVKGSIITTGDNNKQSIRSPDRQQIDDMIALLGKMQVAIEQHSGPQKKEASAALREAVQAAQSDVPDKKAVGSALERALSAARHSADFASSLSTISPAISAAVGWLGGEWVHLLDLLK